MGFRSTFISEDVDGTFAPWFVEKWSPSVNFGGDSGLPISAKCEAKIYNHWQGLESDIQKAINWDDTITNITLVWLHECGGVTRVEIRPDSILYNEPLEWEVKERHSHHYCYGCSDIPESERVLSASVIDA